MPRHRIILILACVIAAVFATGLAFRAGMFRPAPASAAVGGPFQLVDQNGVPTTEKALNGKWSAVFFGFTYCPDVCPGTLQGLAAATDILGPKKAEDLQIVFISVDPERDDAKQMKAYVSADYVPKTTLGLTGTPQQVAAAAKAYRVYFAKVGDGPGYTIDHSTAIYLMDPKGRFSTVIPYNLPPEDIARRINDAMREG
ncbi:MAG: photosynthetic protein synthase I [Caulobacter sp. 12-67-6]|nr:MAG: photosynthetic protein synthase I [Caulobacter sp. 12-67-6]OYX67191.1 MAG: photosynthetic protein synthase I [Caulobacter sp. 32-67-35]OYX98663.1 MAG: photosynthetic protein synthase I [Caulobacter sp. 35-67-4]